MGGNVSFRLEAAEMRPVLVEAVFFAHPPLPGPDKVIPTAFGAVLIGAMGRGWAIPAAGVDRIVPVEMEMTGAGVAYRAADGDGLNTHPM